MVMVAGFEGQYYANAWTLRAQAGYLDSDSGDGYGYLVQEAGFLRAGADYYASKILKVSGEVGYLDGHTNSPDEDATTWDWAVSAEYAFGKSVPVSAYVEYRGQQTEASDYQIERDAISVGVRFYFGGDNDLQKADREGAGFSMPDMTTLSRYYY
jgi:predicted porin